MPLILLIFSIFLLSFFLSRHVFVPQLPAPSHPEWTRVEASTSSSLQATPDSDLMTQSIAMHAERGDDWGSFRTVSLSTWANRVSGKQRERKKGGGEIGRETRNQLVREVWQSDSQCTITLVFRFGPVSTPSGHKFASTFLLILFFFLSLFLAWCSLQWKHIPVMPHCSSLFRFLITNSITCMGWSWPEHKPERGRGP